MTLIAATRFSSARLARHAVRRRDAAISTSWRERLFAGVFSGLVYPQIWEDPVVDAEGLTLRPGDRIATISSGGCNAMSYLASAPARILAVDLNAHHIALLRLKIAAAQGVADHAAFAALFADADRRDNVDLFYSHIAHRLDDETRRYWLRRNAMGRPRIGRFARGFYRYGALGRIIAFAHLLARLHGKRPERLVAARDVIEQRLIFEQEIAPLLASPLTKKIASWPVSLFGLGIPPAQYQALAAGRPMVEVLRERLEKLACGFAIADNYFAWQAFARRYSRANGAALPPYLQRGNFELVRRYAHVVEARQQPLTEALAREPEASLNRYALLDAQDWMAPADLSALWAEITRTAKPGARVLFRTAGEASVLPGRIDARLLGLWRYEEALSRDLTRRDRSAIYGGVHVYSLKRGA